jgi:predicted regulator of Ras-like GTPase activity (Roadblock/LC7/MglB family)
MTKADLLAAALDEFLAVSPDVEAAAIVSADGLPMASALPPDVEEDRLAAMSAALLTLGERAADGLGKGDLAQVFVEGEDGYVVLMAAGTDAVLVAVTSKGTKVGLVLFEMRKAAADVEKIMNEKAPAPVAAEQEEPEEERVYSGPTDVAPVGPVRAPEPTPAEEAESSLPRW